MGERKKYLVTDVWHQHIVWAEHLWH